MKIFEEFNNAVTKVISQFEKAHRNRGTSTLSRACKEDILHFKRCLAKTNICATELHAELSEYANKIFSYWWLISISNDRYQLYKAVCLVLSHYDERKLGRRETSEFRAQLQEQETILAEAHRGTDRFKEQEDLLKKTGEQLEIARGLNSRLQEQIDGIKIKHQELLNANSLQKSTIESLEKKNDALSDELQQVKLREKNLQEELRILKENKNTHHSGFDCDANNNKGNEYRKY